MKLQHKIPLYVVMVMLVAGGAGAVTILSSQRAASTRQFEETSVVLTDAMRNSLEEDMLRGDRQHIKTTLNNVAHHQAILQVEVVGTNGKVWASSGSAADANPRGDALRVLDGRTNQNTFGDPGQGTMTSVSAVQAQSACLKCHGTAVAPAPNSLGYLGAVRATVSTTALQESLDRSLDIMLIVGGLIFVLVAGLLVFLLRRTVLNPLARITGASSRIARGDYGARTPVQRSSNELGEVSAAFNKMADRVQQHTRDLESANRELERANRMKSEFLANMSHELRTPLNVIIGFSEVLRDTPVESLSEGDRREFCENIVSSGYHLLELINDVLDLAKVEAGQMQIVPEEFYVAPVLKEVIATLQPLAAKKQINISVRVSERVSSIFADPGKFKQIMYNLLGNAIKFTPEAGSIDVGVTVMGNTARFAVSDTGIGIAPADQSHIFSEFQQVDASAARQFEGTGLGLALTRKFVEMQGGVIWVESEVGLGSTFYFTMPLPTEKALPAALPAERDLSGVSAAPAVATKTLAAPAAESPRVLVVEDDQTTAGLIGLWLSQDGYQVEYAADGVQALEKARRNDLFAVCLDIMLPRKDGWQVLHQLKNDPRTADLGVIICSALDNPELGFALGAADYCVKPLSRRHLLDKLRHLEKISLTRRSIPQVLVADSSREEAAATGAILRRQGYDVITCHTAREAEALALEHNPDIVLLDFSLAEPNNFELITFLCQHPVTVDTPIVVTTCGEISSKEEEALLGSHVQKVIHKNRDVREELLGEMFRLEKLNPERARMVDPETRLFNRRYFDKRLAEELKRAERYSLDLSLLLVAADGEAGSTTPHLEMLDSMAALLRGNLRAADPLARFDAGRFAVLLPETTREDGFQAARKLVELVRLGRVRDHAGNPIDLAVSVAVTGCHGGGAAGDLILALEKTLEEIRQHGGDAVQLA